jgi:hypothetical protein
MGCECPDDVPLPQGSCNYLIHSGGSIERLYRLVGHIIPNDAELTHGRPIVHDDGSLEFPGDPPELTGYRREGSHLYPAWPPCTLRMLQVQVAYAVLHIAGICGNPRMDDFGFEVSLDQCRKCPFLQNAAT